MLKRLKNLWKLGEYKIQDSVVSDPLLANETTKLIRDIPLGDGKAEFLGVGTEEEYKEQEKADKGLKGIFGL